MTVSSTLPCSIWLRPIVALGIVWGIAACGGSTESAGTSATSPASTESAGADGGSAERITIDGSEALRWGDGDYGVVLAHGAAFAAASWEAQAVRIAGQDSTVVAVEDISPAGILSAVDHLRDDLGLQAVALVGGSAGADAILQLAADRPDLPDQLILLSPNRMEAGLGPEPKLFIASEGEPLVDIARELAETAAGSDNAVLVIPGSAHAQNIFTTDQAEPVTQAVLDRLAQFAGR